MAVDLSDFAPETAEWYQRDPDAAFRRLRAADPLHWYERGGFWCVTRHADVQEVSRRPRVYSSERGTQLFEMIRRTRADARRVGGPAATIIRMDPPTHNLHRKLVMGAFTPRRIAAMEPWIRALAERCLDEVDSSAPVDLVEQVAIPLPMFVIAELLGVPARDHADFRRWSDVMVEAGGGEIGPETPTVVGELVAYVNRVAEERRRAPKDDLISLLQAAEVEGQRLTEGELGMFCLTLLVAGNETTRNLISGGALALARHPEQRARLVAEPERIPNAVEEMLRYVSPVRNFCRVALEDTVLAGKPVRAGDGLVMFYASANRDETVFGPDAERFDVTRESAGRHLAFGFGEHLCLGASLARLEAQVMFEQILRRWPRYELAGEPVPLPSSLMNGYRQLPVRLDP